MTEEEKNKLTDKLKNAGEKVKEAVTGKEQEQEPRTIFFGEPAPPPPPPAKPEPSIDTQATPNNDVILPTQGQDTASEAQLQQQQQQQLSTATAAAAGGCCCHDEDDANKVDPDVVNAQNGITYVIEAVVKNKQGVITDVKIRGHVYPVQKIIDWIEQGSFLFYTVSQKDNIRMIPVSVIHVTPAANVQGEGRHRYLRSKADDELKDNLDNLPIAEL